MSAGEGDFQRRHRCFGRGIDEFLRSSKERPLDIIKQRLGDQLE